MRFHELPLDLFDEKQQPYIKRLNTELRQLFDLEGTLGQPLNTGRGDASIKRKNVVTVDSSRITPEIDANFSGLGTSATFICVTNETSLTRERRLAVSLPITLTDAGANSTITVGVSAAALGTTIGGTPAVGYTTGTALSGSAVTLVRTDATLLAPTFLRSSPNEEVLQLTDDGTDSFLFLDQPHSFSIGCSQFGLSISKMAMGAPFTGADVRFSLSMNPNFNKGGIQSAWAAGTASGSTLFCWDARFSGAGMNLTSCTLVGYDMSSLAVNPAVGSSNNNLMYGMRAQPQIMSAQAGWSECVSVYARGVRRQFITPTIDVQAAIVAEPPTASNSSDQIGIYVRQQTSQVATTNRYGIKVDAQNAGTNRWCFYGVSDRGQFTGPLAVDGAFGATGNAQFAAGVSVTSGDLWTASFVHRGTSICFFNAAAGGTGVSQFTGWSISNFTVNKTINGSSFTLNDVMNTLCTILDWLRISGALAA